MSRTIKTQAVVLRKRSLPNQDKIVTLFTEELGKVNAFAKGIKKITSRRLPHIQTANLIHVVLYKKDERFYLQETSLVSGFSEIKKSSQKLELLYLFLFVVDRLSPENQVETAVFKMVKSFLVELSHVKDPNNELLTKYLNKILITLGYSKEEKSLDQVKAAIEEIINEKIPSLDIM